MFSISHGVLIKSHPLAIAWARGAPSGQEKESSTLEEPEIKPDGGCLLPIFPRVLLISFVNIQAFNSVHRVPMTFG
jgi:hypothetical protein